MARQPQQPSPSPESSFGGFDNEDNVANAARLVDDAEAGQVLNFKAPPATFASFNKAVSGSDKEGLPKAYPKSAAPDRARHVTVRYGLPKDDSKGTSKKVEGGGAPPAKSRMIGDDSWAAAARIPVRANAVNVNQKQEFYDPATGYHEIVYMPEFVAEARAGRIPVTREGATRPNEALASATSSLMASVDAGLCYHLSGLDTNAAILRDNLPKDQAKQRIFTILENVRSMVIPHLRRLGVSDRQMEDANVIAPRDHIAPFFGTPEVRL